MGILDNNKPSVPSLHLGNSIRLAMAMGTAASSLNANAQIGCPINATLDITDPQYNGILCDNNASLTILAPGGSLTNQYLATLNNNSGASITNYQQLDNFGFINNFGSATFTNYGTLYQALNSRFSNYSFLDNHGTINNHGDLANLTASGVMTNHASATINNYGGILQNQNDAQFHNRGTINNAGELLNAGIIDNQGGTSGSASISNKASGAINNYGAIYGQVIENHGIVMNNGTIESDFVGADFLNSGNFENNADFRTLGGNVFSNTGTLTNRGLVVVATQTFSNTNTINNESGAGFSVRIRDAGFTSSYNAGTLNNAGSMSIAGSGFQYPGGGFENTISGTINNDYSLYIYSNDFVNNGLMTNTGDLFDRGGGTFTNNGTIRNYGKIETFSTVLNDGVIYNDGLLYTRNIFEITPNGQVLGTGTFGTFESTNIVNGSLIAEYIIIDEATTLGGSGFIYGASGITFRIESEIRPGASLSDHGDLTLFGNLNSSAYIHIGIDDLSSFDRLIINGTAEFTPFGGEYFGGIFFELDNFTPKAGDSFDFLLTDGLTGFDGINFYMPDLTPGLNWEVILTADSDLRLQFTPIPIPSAAWLFGSGLLGLAGISRRKKPT